MIRYAMIRNGVVENVVLWDGKTEWTPGAEYTMAACPPEVGPGWTYSDGEFSPVAAPSTLEGMKSARLEQLATRRRQATSVVTVGGMTIPWNDTTENRIANAVKALEMKPEGTTVSWEVTRGVFVTLDLPTLMAIALAAFDVQQGAFANVRDMTTLILGAEDEAALAAIDIETGWP